MLKKYLLVFAFFIILAGVLFVLRGDEDTWFCQNNQWVKHGNPSAPMPDAGCGAPMNSNPDNNSNASLPNPASKNCLNQGGELKIAKDETGGEYGLCVFKNGDECEEWQLFRAECQPGIKVNAPQANEAIKSPFMVAGEARGAWFFEASFPVKLADENGNVLATGIATAKSDWMTENFIPFTARLDFPRSVTEKGYLIFNKDNPSGLPENDLELKIPVLLPKGETEKIKLFFNNNNLDPEISCDQVFPVEREIIKTEAVARAAMEELLKGSSAAEKSVGYYTNINAGVTIQKLTIADGTAKVDFDKTMEQAVGGSCRVSAIRAQITETLKQFSTVGEAIISVDGRVEDILQP
ncbi:hypothetical protein A3H03_02060 [Candidatus Kuenenbacteria bacterium RIFCSPLOWO2_12_FULL_42_13]|uniref:GerMN domain-containing protein n=1 Tax=Candidatus Kuenenbacteria bacterium RIFCSPLOWO2_12_FULL_42_13 TaxID=1798565 RepID=A0A1F6G0X2_9BACT|nr:MAG: hypothetical protein A3H03_02060 [Candidatus Kuenenbacteria bacterium RIFCSPLOWO2_12_FULL_42_13]